MEEAKEKQVRAGTVPRRDKYELFELYLSFLTEKQQTSMEGEHSLNQVLLGYWCNLFKSLLKTHSFEVYNYVFEHQEVLDRMLDHL